MFMYDNVIFDLVVSITTLVVYLSHFFVVANFSNYNIEGKCENMLLMFHDSWLFYDNLIIHCG
jgi:hypothetical protein